MDQKKKIYSKEKISILEDNNRSILDLQNNIKTIKEHNKFYRLHSQLLKNLIIDSFVIAPIEREKRDPNFMKDNYDFFPNCLSNGITHHECFDLISSFEPKAKLRKIVAGCINSKFMFLKIQPIRIGSLFPYDSNYKYLYLTIEDFSDFPNYENLVLDQILQLEKAIKLDMEYKYFNFCKEIKYSKSWTTPKIRKKIRELNEIIRSNIQLLNFK